MLDDFGWSPKGVAIKEGPREGWDTAISAYPLAPDGYDRDFAVATAGPTVKMRTEIEAFDLQSKRVKTDGDWHAHDLTVKTVTPDILLHHAYTPQEGRVGNTGVST